MLLLLSAGLCLRSAGQGPLVRWPDLIPRPRAPATATLIIGHAPIGALTLRPQVPLGLGINDAGAHDDGGECDFNANKRKLSAAARLRARHRNELI